MHVAPPDRQVMAFSKSNVSNILKHLATKSLHTLRRDANLGSVERMA